MYDFTAINKNNSRISGILKANSELDLLTELQGNGYTVTKIREKKEEKPFFQKKISLREMSLLCRQLGTMVRVGVPILQALNTIEHQTENKLLKNILNKVAGDLSVGNTLSQSFEKHDQYFPPLFTKMLRAAEKGGNLESSLALLAETFNKDYLVNKRVKSALTYPVIILVVAIILVIFLMVFILPIFVDMFKGMNVPLPLLTRILLGIKDFFTSFGLYLLVPLAFGGYWFFKWAKTDKGKEKVDEFLFKIPIVKGVLQRMAAYRFSQTLRDLYASGVPIESSLQTVTQVIGNKYISNHLKEAIADISRGTGITEALEKTHVFPDLLISMVRIGEETGDMETMLGEVSSYTQYELEQGINQVVSLIEPLMIVFIGVFVGAIVISVILPIYESMSQIGKQ
jgi:type IV pilus assembly protein PilC